MFVLDAPFHAERPERRANDGRMPEDGPSGGCKRKGLGLTEDGGKVQNAAGKLLPTSHRSQPSATALYHLNYVSRDIQCWKCLIQLPVLPLLHLEDVESRAVVLESTFARKDGGVVAVLPSLGNGSYSRAKVMRRLTQTMKRLRRLHARRLKDILDGSWVRTRTDIRRRNQNWALMVRGTLSSCQPKTSLTLPRRTHCRARS